MLKGAAEIIHFVLKRLASRRPDQLVTLKGKHKEAPGVGSIAAQIIGFITQVSGIEIRVIPKDVDAQLSKRVYVGAHVRSLASGDGHVSHQSDSHGELALRFEKG
jgi:hypothetical protein